MNKRGDKLISIYWFAILLLVAGGIVAMVFIFYGNPYDIRAMEGTIMINQISDCLSQKGYLNLEVFDKNFQDNFLQECHINFNTEKEFDWEETLQYYLSVEIFDITNMDSSVVEFNHGNLNLVSSCEIADENYEKLAKCIEGRFYSLGENNEQYLIKVLSIVRKGEKNVK